MKRLRTTYLKLTPAVRELVIRFSNLKDADAAVQLTKHTGKKVSAGAFRKMRGRIGLKEKARGRPKKIRPDPSNSNFHFPLSEV